MHNIIGFVIFSFFAYTSNLFSQNLESYQWKNRIILLKDGNLESDWLQAQLKRLNSNPKELLDRDLVIFLLTDDLVYDKGLNVQDLKSKAIIETYNLSNFEGLVLIGKDGGIKLKEEFIVNSSKVFDLIDSMPMRLTEMKSKGR